MQQHFSKVYNLLLVCVKYIYSSIQILLDDVSNIVIFQTYEGLDTTKIEKMHVKM